MLTEITLEQEAFEYKETQDDTLNLTKDGIKSNECASSCLRFSNKIDTEPIGKFKF